MIENQHQYEILSGLKTWLETGELLTTPGSLMYADAQPQGNES